MPLVPVLSPVLSPMLALLLLASCSHGENGAGSSLNADDLWDQMAAERAKPLPVVTSGVSDGNSGVLQDHMLPAFSPDLFSPEELDKQREILRKAPKKYRDISENISGALALYPEQSFETSFNAEEKQAQRQTVQLHLSRLISLGKNMEMAIKALGRGGEDQPLLDKSSELRAIISERVIDTQKHLAEETTK